MTKKNIFNVVADVKKALESDKHFVYTSGDVYDVCSFEITGISVEGAIRAYNDRTEEASWFNLNQLMTKADAENEKKKDLETRKQKAINRYKRYIAEYKQQIKELEES